MLIKSKSSETYKSFRIEKRNWREKVAKGYGSLWDKYFYLYSKRLFLPLAAKKVVAKENIFYNETLKRNGDYFKKVFKLRDYQRRAVERVRKNGGLGLIDSKTGTGKSFMIMGLVEEFKTSFLILVSSINLLEEMRQKFLEFTNIKEEDLGVYYSKEKQLGRPIMIITKQSFTKLYKDYIKNKGALPRGQLLGNGSPHNFLVVDECDTNLSRTFVDAINEYGADNIVGLTGTPTRAELNTLDLVKFYGPLIKGGTYQEYPRKIIQLIYDRGLKNGDIIKIRGQLQRQNGSFDLNMAEKIIDSSEKRDEKIFEIFKKIIENKHLTLILFRKKDNAEKWYKLFNLLRGDKVALITGDTKAQDDYITINDYKNRIKNGEKGFAIFGTYQKLGRGIDIDVVDSVVLYAKIKLKPAIIQAIGRALRQTDKFNKDAIIFTINDNFPVVKSQIYAQAKGFKEEYGDIAAITKMYIKDNNWDSVMDYLDEVLGNKKYQMQSLF